MTQPILHSPDPERWLLCILEKIQLSDTGCWLWTDRLSPKGYGLFKFRHDGRRFGLGAHRASWLAFRGDIPDPLLQIDHLCRVRQCVNPEHMELVTCAVNVARGNAGSKPGPRPRFRFTWGQPSCQEHGRKDGYDYVRGGGRIRWVCRICRRARRSRAKKNLASPVV